MASPQSSGAVSFLSIMDNALSTLSNRESNTQHRRNFTYRRNHPSMDILSFLSNQVIDEYIQNNPRPFEVIDHIISLYIERESAVHDGGVEGGITPFGDTRLVTEAPPDSRALPVRRADINALCPYKKVTRDDELICNKECCSICQDEYKFRECKRTLPCNHTYHKKCIDPWLIQHADCPICRTSFRSTLSCVIKQ